MVEHLPCNQEVVGSIPTTSSNNLMYPSGDGAVLIKQLPMVRFHPLGPLMFITINIVLGFVYNNKHYMQV